MKARLSASLSLSRSEVLKAYKRLKVRRESTTHQFNSRLVEEFERQPKLLKAPFERARGTDKRIANLSAARRSMSRH